MAWRRAGSVLIAVVAFLAGLLTPLIVASAPASALSVSDFDPGYIISDGNFYNGAAMSEAEIQRFLESQVGSCANSNCLAVYRADTPTRTWSFGTCSTYYGGAAESAARIIFKVQQACNLSAKVILVTLQKEQGLITDSDPSDGVMRKAMGYGCPDTSDCDSTFYGFFNQLFAAGRQLTWYSNPAGSFTSIRIGQTNAIRYNPDAGCGSKSVVVRNKATAALYYYTPYTPNAAALNNLYGTGDYCSAYGNRNFWRFYSNWFGQPAGPDGPALIAAEYAAQGGPSGHLGAPITNVITIVENGGGLGQAFQHGSIYWTASTGALTVREGPLRDYYFRFGGAAGPLGWPILNQQPIDVNGGGLGQLFTGGSLYASTVGTFLVRGAMRDGYFSQNGAAGPLGWPVGDVTCGQPAGACSQLFQAGAVYWTDATGARASWGSINQAYVASGGMAGGWGVPTSDQVYLAPNGGGFGQAFAKGSTYAQGGAAYFVNGPVRDLYFSRAGATGSLGFPTSAEHCDLPGGECAQSFQFGAIIRSNSGVARVASPEIEAAYARAGGRNGTLGAASGELTYYPYNGSGLAQGYAAGPIYWKPSLGAFAVTGAIRDAYFAQGGVAGPFGWPKQDAQCGVPAGVCSQMFEGATVYGANSAPAFGVFGALLQAYVAAGGPQGSWGLPLTQLISIPQNGGGSGQAFSNGSTYTKGSDPARFVSGPIRDDYFALSGAAGTLGFPVSDQTCGQPVGVCSQSFQGGYIVWSSSTGAQVVSGLFLAKYLAAGGMTGSWGLPLTPSVGLPFGAGGNGQAFQGASVYRTVNGGAYAVSGSIRDFYFARGGAAGPLGYPVGDMACAADGVCSQPFEAGTVRSAKDGSPSLG